MSVSPAGVCPLFNFSSTEKALYYQDVVVDIRVAVSSLSFCGSLFVIALIWVFKKYKFFVQRLILYLSLSAFLSSIAYISGRVNYDPTSLERVKFCEAQGFLLLYTDWTVILSVLCITTNLFLSVFLEKKPRRLEVIFIGVVFFLPLPISSIPFFHQAFGPSGAWCWIRNKKSDCTQMMEGEYLQFAVWYVPQYILILVLFLMYVAIIVRLKAKTRRWQGLYDPNLEHQRSLMKKEIKPLIWYPTVYFIISFFPLVNRIVTNVTMTSTVPLYVLHVLTSPLQGALTALVYALDKDTLQRLNWRNIRASLKYRNTDRIVKDYPVGPSTEENYPFISDYQHQPSSSPAHHVSGPSHRPASPSKSVSSIQYT